jgi:hypothetical protein
MLVQFDNDVGFEGALLIGWANVGSGRIRCLAGRETINELQGFTHASAAEIRNRKHEIFEMLKPAFIEKIESNQLDRSTIPSVTVYLHDIERVEPIAR